MFDMAQTPTWDVLDYGTVPKDASVIEYTCECGYDAELPVVGMAIAQIEMGLVFDQAGYAIPPKIRCRKCRRVFVLEPHVR